MKAAVGTGIFVVCAILRGSSRHALCANNSAACRRATLCAITQPPVYTATSQSPSRRVLLGSIRLDVDIPVSLSSRERGHANLPFYHVTATIPADLYPVQFFPFNYTISRREIKSYINSIIFP